MCISAKIYIVLHLNHFKQLDHYFSSKYKFQIKLWKEAPNPDLENRLFIMDTYQLSSQEFETKIYEIKQIDEYFFLHFETLCFPEFKTSFFIELKFLVHGIKSQKFPSDADGWSHIGTTQLKIPDPFNSIHQYMEVTFDDFICSVVSLGIHTSMVSFAFKKIPPELLANLSPNLKQLYSSDTFVEFLEKLTKNGSLVQTEDFYHSYNKKLIQSCENIVLFLTVQIKDLLQETRQKITKDHPNYKELVNIEGQIAKIFFPKESEFLDFIKETKAKKKDEILGSQFQFSKYDQKINNKDIILDFLLDEDNTQPDVFNDFPSLNSVAQITEVDGKLQFTNHKKVLDSLIQEIARFSNFGQQIFVLQQKLIKLSGREMNQDLRIEFHFFLKEKYLENLFSEELFGDSFIEAVESNFLKQEKMASKQRTTITSPMEYQQFHDLSVVNITMLQDLQY